MLTILARIAGRAIAQVAVQRLGARTIVDAWRAYAVVDSELATHASERWRTRARVRVERVGTRATIQAR